jgi:hypothetical protein
MLDSLNPGIRHLILAVVPVILGVLSTDFVPQLQSVNPFVATAGGGPGSAGPPVLQHPHHAVRRGFAGRGRRGRLRPAPEKPQDHFVSA